MCLESVLKVQIVSLSSKLFMSEVILLIARKEKVKVKMVLENGRFVFRPWTEIRMLRCGGFLQTSSLCSVLFASV